MFDHKERQRTVKEALLSGEISLDQVRGMFINYVLGGLDKLRENPEIMEEILREAERRREQRMIAQAKDITPLTRVVK